ncbi:oxidoreductase [Kitasatospora aureofaciens]|uniref:oxidoreductase n=1 Tax=Kitasatospora aureofaciens TaxID=1894 RepID=UPI000AF55954|nr:oxidoreductase [Kitasatospora aureofaciens]
MKAPVANTAAPPPALPADALGRVVDAARRDLAGVEDRRRLGPEAVAAVVAAGFPRHFVPRELGGTAGTFAELLGASAEIARTCPSTAWCAILFAAHGRLAAYLPEEGRKELWGASPDVLIATSIMPPQGEAVRDGDGWRIRGRWDTASGVDHAYWLLLATRTGPADRPEHRIFAVPRSDWTVLDTWRSLGMRGTGSNAVEVAGAFVPDRLSCTLADLQRPLGVDAARCHRVPVHLAGALMFAAPVLGAAEGAFDAWRSAVTPRLPALSPARRAEAELALGEGSARIAAARLLLERVAERADRAEVTPLLVAENRRDAAMAAAWCAEAVDRLFRAAGSQVQREDSPIQRYWRDVTTAASHGVLGPAAAAADYAAAVLDG